MRCSLPWPRPGGHSQHYRPHQHHSRTQQTHLGNVLVERIHRVLTRDLRLVSLLLDRLLRLLTVALKLVVDLGDALLGLLERVVEACASIGGEDFGVLLCLGALAAYAASHVGPELGSVGC